MTRLVKVRGEHRWTAVPAYAGHASSSEELAKVFHTAQHEIARVVDPTLDPWDRYRAASRASAALATLVLHASGYETVPPGDPKGAFDALPVLLGAEGRAPAAAFLSCIRRSSRKKCPWAPAALDRELRKLSREVGDFRKSVLEWIESTRRPLLVTKAPGSRIKTDPHQRMLF
jgi:hypothetical protein